MTRSLEYDDNFVIIRHPSSTHRKHFYVRANTHTPTHSPHINRFNHKSQQCFFMTVKTADSAQGGVSL